VKIALGLFSVIAIAATLHSPRAQTADVFFQAAEDGSARPLTTDEKAKLQDPVFRLILTNHADVTTLSDIEALIQPDHSKRRIFVVDEKIKDPKQPATRRSVIMFDGSSGDTQLPGNIALSLPFSSDAMPDKGVEVEAWGWDVQNGVYNFYRLDQDGTTTPAMSWKFRGSSKEADRLPADSRPGTCLRCHTSGAPIMKELEFPWNNWHSVASPATYLTSNGPPEQRWPVVNDSNFPQLSGGEALEPLIKGAIGRFNSRRLADFVNGDAQTGLTVTNAKILLKPLFDTTEINLESAQQESGLHPFSDPSSSGPSKPVQIPDNFFLQSDIMAGTDDIPGIGVSEATGFGAAATITPAEYKELVDKAGLQLVPDGNTTLPGDTNFAWLTPVTGFAATNWVGTLVKQKVISPELVAAVLAVDLETPVFSNQRRGLLSLVSDSFSVTPGEPYPDTLARQLIATLEAANLAADSPEADFLTVLKTPSPVQELKARVTAYRNREAQKLGDAATRPAELERLFDLLIARRRLVETFPDSSHFPMFGSLIESGALLPLPVPSRP
jgi:hypothetical protein